MHNEIIILSENDSATAEFDSQLQLPDKVFFVVLGNTPTHADLANRAKEQAENWRWVIWAKEPQFIHQRLLSLPLRPGVLQIFSPWPATILAVSISVNNYICRTVTSATGNVISPAFMLAETYMQP